MQDERVDEQFGPDGVGMKHDQALAARLERLQAEPVIDFGSVEFEFSDPAGLRAEFDEIFDYFARVEGAVPQNVADITSLLPDLQAHEQAFLDVWSAQEAAHSVVFETMRDRLGLKPSVTDVRPQARRSFRAVGTVARIPWFGDVLRHVYLTRGAMHERMTYDGYRHLGCRLTERGELSLARTVTDPIRRQEALHLGYYRAAAAALRQQLSRSQLWWARNISIRTYLPVGAARGERSAECGRVFSKLAGEHIQEVLSPVEAIASLMLADHAPLPPFVSRAMARCMAEGERIQSIRR